MGPFSFLLNLLWIVFGGLWMALAWVIAAVIMAITIIGLPCARAAVKIASYTLLSFGQKGVSRANYLGSEDIGTGRLGVLRQYRVAAARRLVAGARASHHRYSARRYHDRHPLRLGASKAGRDRALAYRRNDVG